MTFGSLFAGIGGIDLGLERAGMTCAWQVEKDDYCRRVLAKHWPDVARYEDVREVGAANLARVDLIAGGFPCQDISYAGRGAGLSGERSGLWFEFARVIREMGPSFVLVENVAALLTRGLDAVLGTLASLGYDAEWHCIPAAAVGAPHRRDRLFIVAYHAECVRGDISPEKPGRCGNDWPCQSHRGLRGALADPERQGLALGQVQRRDVRQQQPAAVGGCGEVPDAAAVGRRAWRQGRPAGDCEGSPEQAHRGVPNANQYAPIGAAIARCQRREWEPEPDVGRVADGVPHRVDRLRGLGNAVVPQVAELIGRAILAVEGGER